MGATSRTAVPGATLKRVWTSYCGSCIKVDREDWGRGTKKVKAFAHTRVRKWSMISLDSSISGLDTAQQRKLPLQTGSTKYELGHWLNRLHHVPSPPIDCLGASQNTAKLQTRATSTCWSRAIFHEGSVPSGTSLGSSWLWSFFTLQLPSLPHRETKHQT